ncbi:MAG: cardiolipin synthase [Oscillospiraceae bacterium]
MSKMLRRVLTVIPAAAVQALWILLLVKWLSPYAAYITLALSVAAVLLVLFIIIKRDETAYKILWLLVILTVPVAGALLYLLFGNRRTARPLRKRLRRVQEAGQPAPLPCGGTPFEGEKRMEQTVRWLEHKTGYPLMRAEDVRYYPLGDAMYPDMLTDLRAAKKTIYLEYFIIEPGEMWQSIVDILAQKVREGLDVRVMYDDLGSISTFNFSNALALEKLGIRCATFNPLLALKGTANYRDHRKMLIVDDAVAYSGGVNLADRYINREHPYGHWKDTGFRLTGAPVRSFTHMFLTFWNAFSLQKEEPMPMPPAAAAAEPAAQDGWVLSYYDSPLNSEATSNRLYIDLLSQATDYAWFFTPYLMLGDDLLDAMLAAAQRGVDVRIIMPGIPDKKLIFRMSRSFYQVLLTGGVKIYEYTPGFVHAKSLVCDDRAATVGTVNLDYRSLFLHFENNSLFYRGSIVARVKEDFLATQSQCRAVEACDMKRYSRRWIVDGVLRIFAPLC